MNEALEQFRAGLALEPDNAHLQEAAAAERWKTREAIRRCVDRGVGAGDLRPDLDADGLSTLAEALLVGMSIQARDGVSGASLQAAVAGVLGLWDANSTVESAST